MLILCFPSVPREESMWDQLEIELGTWIDQARHAAGMSHTEMWLNAGYSEGSQWTRSLQGKRGVPIDLKKLIRQPPRWWLAFLPIFMQGMTEFWWQHFWEDRNALTSLDRRPAHLDRLADVGRPRPVRATLDADQPYVAADRTARRV